MQLSKQAINEFKEIYFKTFGVKISDAEANQKGLQLLSYFKLFYKQMPTKDKCLIKKLSFES